MLDSIYHMTLKSLKTHFDLKAYIFCNLLCSVIMDVITLRY